jgi:hypothetical protein
LQCVWLSAKTGAGKASIADMAAFTIAHTFRIEYDNCYHYDSVYSLICFWLGAPGPIHLFTGSLGSKCSEGVIPVGMLNALRRQYAAAS